MTLDHIPEGCDYDLILYDGDGNQVGIGRDNGNGGKSVTVPNWNLENREYTVKVLAKDGSPVNAEEYYHLSFQTQKAAGDNVLRQQAKEMQEYAGALRRKLHDGQDAAEEKQALQQIREKYGAYYAQQMDELHKAQAAEYLPEGEVFDESRKAELLSKMAAGGELTEQEKGLANIFASAQEIDSATASAKLQADIGEEIFRQMGQSGISPIPSFEVSIGIDGKAEVKGIEDAAVKEKVENGRIKGLDAPLDKLLNDPGQNQTYLDYRADILAIKNYERMQGNGLLGGFSARYAVDGQTIRTVSV